MTTLFVQVPFLLGSAVALVGLGLGAVLATVSGAYCGALCGFCSGAVGFALWAIKTHYETAAVGAKFAGLTFKAFRRIVLALGCHTMGLTKRRLI